MTISIVIYLLGSTSQCFKQSFTQVPVTKSPVKSSLNHELVAWMESFTAEEDFLIGYEYLYAVLLLFDPPFGLSPKSICNQGTLGFDFVLVLSYSDFHNSGSLNYITQETVYCTNELQL